MSPMHTLWRPQALPQIPKPQGDLHTNTNNEAPSYRYMCKRLELTSFVPGELTPPNQSSVRGLYFHMDG